MWLPSDTLQHSRGPWKRHKYTAIKNGRYIYPGESVEGTARNYRQAAKTAAREQEKGKNWPELNYQRERRRAVKREARESRAFDSAAREQEKGRNRTAANVKLLKGTGYGASKTAAKARYQAKIARGGKTLTAHGVWATRSIKEDSTAQSRKYENIDKTARAIYRKGKRAAGTDPRKQYAASGNKPKNKTYKKNQRRAKLESLIFQGKRKVKKLLKKLTPHSGTKVTVTSNLMPAGTKKDITKQYNDMKKKKKKR